MPVMTIGEAAARTGLAPSAIRYYEKEGLLTPPERKNGQRRYEVKTLEHLMVIQHAKKAGFTMAEIKQLFHGFKEGTPASKRWRVMASEKIAEMDELIAKAKVIQEILRRTARCQCLKLEDCGRGALAKRSS